MKILHIDSSVLGDYSGSRQLSAATVAALRQQHADATVTYRDVGANPPDHVSGGLVMAMNSPDRSGLDASLRAAAAEADAMLEEVLAADVLVIGAPMYNFGVPTQLKAWFDRVTRAGRTFRYTASGPEGLAGGRKLYILSSRGGAYAGQPFEAVLDHQEAWLKAVFNFIGITDITVIRAEGANMGDETRDAGRAAALAEVARVVK
ncbi:MAG: FMN-dependent NADH-azoreductase [Pseudomonadota bacterium]|jgi:FMN-dependent NADH-azoreductase